MQYLKTFSPQGTKSFSGIDRDPSASASPFKHDQSRTTEISLFSRPAPNSDKTLNTDQPSLQQKKTAFYNRTVKSTLLDAPRISPPGLKPPKPPIKALRTLRGPLTRKESIMVEKEEVSEFGGTSSSSSDDSSSFHSIPSRGRQSIQQRRSTISSVKYNPDNDPTFQLGNRLSGLSPDQLYCVWNRKGKPPEPAKLTKIATKESLPYSRQESEVAVKKQDSKRSLFTSDGSILRNIPESEVAAQSEILVMKKKAWGDQFVVSRKNSALQLWLISQTIINFFSAFYYAFIVAFYDKLDDSDIRRFYIANTALEALFMGDVILNFFIEKTDFYKRSQTNDLRIIASSYLREGFFFDLVTGFPIPRIAKLYFSNKMYRLSFLLRLLRLEKATFFFNTKVFVSLLRHLQSVRINKIIHSSRNKAHSQLEDQTHIQLVLVASKIHQAVRMIAIVLCLSFFGGMLWYLEVEMESEISSGQENFLADFGLESKSFYDIALALTYYVATTITTVGLGDFHPKSNSERLLAIAVLLFGVLITSTVMENFSLMLKKIRDFSAEYEDSRQLQLFLGTMKRFNENVELSPKLVESIEVYFKYRWETHKNFAVMQGEAEQKLYDELPAVVKRCLYHEYLFVDFLSIYKKLFGITPMSKRLKSLKRVRKKVITNKSIRESQKNLLYTDAFSLQEDYHDFILQILQVLEPKQTTRKLLQKQNQTVDEIVFILRGEFLIGYNNERLLEEAGFLEENQNYGDALDLQIRNYNKVIFPLTCREGQPIGFYETCFERRSQFIYKLKENKTAEMLFIRKRSWKQVVEAQKTEGGPLESFKTKVLLNYIDRLYLPLKGSQDKMLQLAQKRKDQKRVCFIISQLAKKKIDVPAHQEEVKAEISSSSSSSIGSTDSEEDTHIGREALIEMVADSQLTKIRRNQYQLILQDSNRNVTELTAIIESLDGKFARLEDSLLEQKKENQELRRQLRAEQEKNEKLVGEKKSILSDFKNLESKLKRQGLKKKGQTIVLEPEDQFSHHESFSSLLREQIRALEEPASVPHNRLDFRGEQCESRASKASDSLGLDSDQSKASVSAGDTNSLSSLDQVEAAIKVGKGGGKRWDEGMSIDLSKDESAENILRK